MASPHCDGPADAVQAGLHPLVNAARRPLRAGLGKRIAGRIAGRLSAYPVGISMASRNRTAGGKRLTAPRRAGGHFGGLLRYFRDLLLIIGSGRRRFGDFRSSTSGACLASAGPASYASKPGRQIQSGRAAKAGERSSDVVRLRRAAADQGDCEARCARESENGRALSSLRENSQPSCSL
jgi:hypothetical protein